jgi:flagella basal body P-ring formation protein FlgA
VLVEGENVMVSTKGVLRSDAVIGGVARVMCTASKKEINGMLVSSDTVKVKI